MRHTLVMVLALLLSAGAIVYALLVVGSDLRQVSDELDVVTRDMGGMADDVRSLADDVNAIADALAGEDDGDDTRQSPAAARVVAAPSARRLPSAGSTRRARVHRARARGPLVVETRR